MENRQNWDFTYCSKFPRRHLINKYCTFNDKA